MEQRLRPCVSTVKAAGGILPSSCVVKSLLIDEKREIPLALTLTNESQELAHDTSAVISVIQTIHTHITAGFNGERKPCHNISHKTNEAGTVQRGTQPDPRTWLWVGRIEHKAIGALNHSATRS